MPAGDLGYLKVADVQTHVGLSLYQDFVDLKEFKPDARHEDVLATMLDQVIAWSEALRPLRAAAA